MMLTLEQYAIARAHIVHFNDRDSAEVRRQLGVDEEWIQSQQHWLDVLKGALSGEGRNNALTFAAAFTSTRTYLVADEPALQDIEPIIEGKGEGPDFEVVEQTSRKVPVVSNALPFNAQHSSAYLAKLAEADNVITENVNPGGTEALDSGSAEAMAVLRSRFSLEQYAALSAEMAEQPQKHQAVLERHGLSGDDELMELMTAWSRYFTENPAARKRWQEAVNASREWMQKEGK